APPSLTLPRTGGGKDAPPALTRDRRVRGEPVILRAKPEGSRDGEMLRSAQHDSVRLRCAPPALTRDRRVRGEPVILRAKPEGSRAREMLRCAQHDSVRLRCAPPSLTLPRTGGGKDARPSLTRDRRVRGEPVILRAKPEGSRDGEMLRSAQHDSARLRCAPPSLTRDRRVRGEPVILRAKPEGSRAREMLRSAQHDSVRLRCAPPSLTLPRTGGGKDAPPSLTRDRRVRGEPVILRAKPEGSRAREMLRSAQHDSARLRCAPPSL